MLNYIWFGLLVFGLLIGIFNGRIEQVSQAALESARNAVELSIALLGIMCLWTGMMNIAKKSGVINMVAKAARPLLRVLFPDVPGNHPALESIVMNLSANFLGLGNAATPLGLKAMKDLDSLNRHKGTATDAMCMFLILNTAAFQLIPAQIIAIRSSMGSANPAEIILPIWITSLCTNAAGIISVKILSRFYRKKRFL